MSARDGRQMAVFNSISYLLKRCSTVRPAVNKDPTNPEKPTSEPIVADPPNPVQSDRPCPVQTDAACSTYRPDDSSPTEVDAEFYGRIVWPPQLLQTLSADFGGNNFPKSCEWSPSGAYLLTNADDRLLRLYGLDGAGRLLPQTTVASARTVHDCCWTSAGQIAYCSRNCPLFVCNVDGEQVANFTPMNSKDELAPCISVAVHPSGDRLFAGSHRTVYVFDSQRPGQQWRRLSTWQRSVDQTQPGLISCFAFPSTCPSSFFAASYKGVVALYDFNMPSSGACMAFQANSTGLTCMAMTPCGRYLFTGGRNDQAIVCWDVRMMPVEVSRLTRPASSQQRLRFQLSRSGDCLLSGTSQGLVSVWCKPYGASGCLEPDNQLAVANSPVNAVSLNERTGMMAVSCGQRTVVSLDVTDDDDENILLNYQSSDNRVTLWSLDNDERPCASINDAPE